MGKGLKKGGFTDLNPLTGPIKRASYTWGEISGSNRAAEAAQRAADAQASAAARTRSELLSYVDSYESDLANLAKATPQELNALSQSFSAAEQNLGREQRLLDAIDPALMEASKQALALMRGESAGITKPMNDMRAMQRRQLVDSLRSQYGPGAESTSIGQRALQQFDMQSSSMFADQQQGALAQAFGMATSDVGARNRLAISQLQGVGEGYGSIQNRMINARQMAGTARMSALTGTAPQMIQNAGAAYVGDSLRAQSQGQLANLAARAGAAYFTGGMSEAGLAAAGGGGGGGLFSQPQAAPSNGGGFAGAGGGRVPFAYYG